MKIANETTTSVMDKLQNSPYQNVVILLNDQRLLLSTSMIKALAWNSVPDLIKDPDSEQAKKHGALRTGLKALIRPFLPDLLHKTWGTEVELEPRLNILTWLPGYIIHLLINMIASREWEVKVEQCETCGGSAVYKVVGLSPLTTPVSDSSETPTTSTAAANHQHLQRGKQPDASRAEDRNLAGGSVGDSGRPQVREEYV